MKINLYLDSPKSVNLNRESFRVGPNSHFWASRGIALCAAAICLTGTCTHLQAVSVRTPGVDVDVGINEGYYYYYDNEAYQAWTGPGWYYGLWFDRPDVYYYWLSNNFYDVYWVGPGWYYGIWFDSEPYFNDYRRYHRYYGPGYYRGYSSPVYHSKKHRGKWNDKHHSKNKKNSK